MNRDWRQEFQTPDQAGTMCCRSRTGRTTIMIVRVHLGWRCVRGV
jgi:hypothetical protein